MEKFVKILIVEDEIFISDYIKELLEQEGFLKISQAYSAEEAEELMNHLRPDIIIMDINLDGNFEGIELAKNKNKEASVIFLTAQNDLEIIKKALESQPQSYLTKPIKKTDFLVAVSIAIQHLETETLVIKTGYTEERLKIEEILYLCSDKNYTDIYTKDRKITLRESLKNLFQKLPKSIFVQIHRSYIVNKKHVEKCSSSTVFINGEKLPCSRNYPIEW